MTQKSGRRVLVTGGAGFIGGHLVDRLVELGNEVFVIDRVGTREMTDFNNGVKEYIEGDIADTREIDKAFIHRPEVVLHVAGQASTFKSFDSPEDDLRTNVQGTLQVLQACIKYGVKRLLYASSMVVYGHPESLPIDEEIPSRPISYYGVTKYAAERYVHATAERADLNGALKATSFRMFNVFGERQSLTNPYQGVMGIFIGNVLRGEPITIFGDGKQTRDFIYIDDIVEAWISAIDRPQTYGEVFNLGSGRRHSINELVDMVIAAFSRSRNDYPVVYAEPRLGDQRDMEANIAKAKGILGWAPKISFEEGLNRTVSWAIDRRHEDPSSH